jgi:type VI secretion system secreted protein VgrG
MTDLGSAFGSAFSSTALDASRVRVVSVDGFERLGELYEFRVRIESAAGPLTESQIDQLLLAPCVLSIGTGDPINGIAREVEVVRTRARDTAIYDVVVVPTMWLLTISRVSRLYQAMSVKAMAADVLKRYGLAAHCDLRMSAGTPREFCIQYQESDWDFLQRWFEHEGFFYWFEHSSDGEKLVVADDNSQTTPIGGDTAVEFLALAGMLRTKECVFEWRGACRRIPANVILKDYNPDKPLLPMLGQAEVDRKRGFGVVFEYGDNFDAPAAGNDLAKKRAERFLTERLKLSGVTDSPRFHVGHWFELTGHFDSEQNRKYLITAIDHRVGDVSDEGSGGNTSGYRAAFEAIPLDTQFRPARKTPWPSIHGLMPGHIDSGTGGKFSTLDDKARYRVRFPFDTTGKTGESCSTWVRMAQHYSGPGYGSHFPLHRGTEVLLAFYDGDPDRPVIVGAIANALTPSPSTGANAPESIVNTHAGTIMTFNDARTK